MNEFSQNQFAQYLPENWLVDGVLLKQDTSPRNKSKSGKFKNETVKNSLVLALIASAISVHMPVNGFAAASSTKLGTEIISVETTSSSLVNLDNSGSVLEYIRKDSDDIVMGAFLSFINHQIENKSELVVPANSAQLQRISDLLKDV